MKTWLTLNVLLLALATTAFGQHYQPFGDLDVYNDMQLFAPPIIEEYGDEAVAPNYGWFGEYHRANLRLSRPENVSSSFEEDRLWGNMFEFGYMTEDNHGWLVSIVDFGNTNAARFTAVTDIQGNMFTLQNNVNAGQYDHVELNKTFRVHVGEHGTYFEPFGGGRVGQFKETLNTESLVFDDPANPLLETGTGTRGRIDNHMIGGQFGLRSYFRHGHWILTGEARGFASINFQELQVTQSQIITVADGLGGFVVQNPIETRVDESFEKFAFGGELRLEAAYELTRQVRISLGAELLTIGHGLSRGFDDNALTSAGANDQAATYFGYFFGIQCNR